MGHSHVDRTLNKVALNDFDITGPQMVLTLKLTSFAWNVWDGRRPAEVSLTSTGRGDSLTDQRTGAGQKSNGFANC